MARNIVDHGRWFVINRKALDLIQERQTQAGRLLDLSQIDLSRVDRQPLYVDEIQQMPGLAVVTAGLWWISGSHTYAVLQWLQIVIDTGMIFLVFWITMRLTLSRRISLFAALLYSIWLAAIVVARRPVPDTWAGFFVIASVGAFVWARERPQTVSRLVPLGMLTGLGIYFRPFIALLPLTLALVGTPHGNWPRRFIWFALPTGVALLLLSPWTVRNFYEFDRFIPTRTGLGQAVFEGVGGAPTDQHAEQTVRRHNPDAHYGTPAYDDFLVGAAARAIIHHPSWYLRLVLHRSRFLLPLLLVPLVWRRWKSAGLILTGAAMATIVPYLLIGDDTRFYLPAAFAYLILGSMASAVVLSHLPRLRWSFRRRGLPALSETGPAE